MFAAISWWVVIQLFSLAALPLAWRLFGRLPGHGYALTKALGLLLVSYILWIGASLHLLPNTLGGAAVAFLLMAAASFWFGRAGLRREDAASRPLVAWLRRHWLLVLATELLFALVFFAWTAFRAYNPEIAGTEKPMEFAFINGVLRSRFFPPQDPWLSGYAISYYYFGYVMLGLLIRLTGVDPAVGFNLGVALWYALTMAGAFGVVYELVGLAGVKRETSGVKREASDAGVRAGDVGCKWVVFGALAALFVGFVANLEGLVEVAYQRGLVPLVWIQWLDIKQLTDAPPTGGWTGGFWWWWRASRVIHDRDLLGNSVEVIDEFPFFSFLLGDIHPHVLALPFVLLAIAAALSLMVAAAGRAGDVTRMAAPADAVPEDRGIPTGRLGRFAVGLWRSVMRVADLTEPGAAGLLVYGLVFGALGFLNTWDFPIYVALATAAVAAGLALTGGLTWAVVRRAAGAGLVLAIAGWLLYLPFYIGFQSQLGGILPNLLFPSRFSQFFVMFGLFLVIAVAYLAVLARSASWPVLRRATLLALPWFFITPVALLALFLLFFTVLPPGQAFLQTILDNPAVRSAVGDRSVGQLAGLILSLRVRNPWTYLILAGLSSWVAGTLGALLHGRPAVASPGPDEPRALRLSDLFAMLMIGLALLLTFSVEFVYLRDLFGTRMNTVFKFYYQAWVMLALAAALALSRLTARGLSWGFKAPVLAVIVALIAGSLVYAILAIPSKAGDFRGRPTLDGLAFLRESNRADVAAIEWIRANVPADAVVVEAAGGSYSPEGAGRISMSTGNPTLLGWDFHERQWRGTAYDRLATGRPEALDQIYRTARAEDLPALLARWGVDYVVVGPLERRKFGISDAALARFDRGLRRVYEHEGVRVYAR